MNDSLYSRFSKDDLILRDELAIDRTLLANERTLLAFLRAGAALLIAGASIMHFSRAGWFWMIGLVCIPSGIITVIIGTLRYRRMKRNIALVREQFLVNRENTSSGSGPETPSPP
jgi:putative membrane protein